MAFMRFPFSFRHKRHADIASHVPGVAGSALGQIRMSIGLVIRPVLGLVTGLVTGLVISL
jgi:hypothetical protein